VRQRSGLHVVDGPQPDIRRGPQPDIRRRSAATHHPPPSPLRGLGRREASGGVFMATMMTAKEKPRQPKPPGLRAMRLQQYRWHLS